MAQSNFNYASAANDAAGLPLAVSIFADRAQLRGVIRDDAEAAGFRVAQVAELEALLDGDACALGEVVLVDCPEVDGLRLAALARLDMRAAHSGARIVISTSVAALDDVFACMDQSRPEILVDPGRADRVIALGRILGDFPGLRVRELAQEDRLMLLRLTEQVGRIAERLERLEAPASGTAYPDDSAFSFEAPKLSFKSQADNAGDHLVRAIRPPLPDPRLVRRIIRQRQLRARFFDGDLFADPAWDMLLDLTAARVEHTRVSVTSLCIASGVPPTTALRWIAQMTEAGLFQRVEDDIDRRRAFITLSDRAINAMAQYFAKLGTSAGSLA